MTNASNALRSNTQAGRLIIVPTPLGNLGDMTYRAVEALRTCDVVCAEDTRVTGKLLAHFDIEKRIERLDEALISARAEKLMQRVLDGEVIAYCSDAGMPGVSDPGLRLVAAAHAQGVCVEVLPGPTAVACAYVASGTICPRFYFGGFFPRKTQEQLSCLEALRSLDAALVFYESPRRLVAALKVVAQVFPHREVAVCRELTKLHEEVARGRAEELVCVFEASAEEPGGIRGEIAFVIDVAPASEMEESQASVALSAEARARELAEEGIRTKAIAKALVAEYGLARNDAYELAMRAQG
jgi:16S rRNA (cytidine1402-2'-O)-methyltransferase